MRRLLVLAIALFAIGCSSHSTAPEPAPISPQVFQKQPFNSSWTMRKLQKYTWPIDLAVGSKWYIWIADNGDKSITRLDLRGTARHFPISFKPLVLVIGSDQNVWIGGTTGTVARVDQAGVETDYTVGSSNANVQSIVEGSDGAVWFSVDDANTGWSLGRIDTAGNITLYPQYTPVSLAAGPDGNLWFSDDVNMNVVNTQGQIVAQYSFTDFVTYSTVGPDGNLWYADGSQLAKVTMAGQITRYPAPIGLYDIASWNGQLWMTDREQANDSLISFDPVGKTFGSQITSPVRLRRLIVGQDGNFWMSGPNALVVIYVNQIMTVNPTSLNLKVGRTRVGSNELTVTEANYNGTWSAEWNPAIVNVVQTSPGVFTVTAAGPGTGKITINDTMKNFTKIPVTVQ